MKLDNEFCSYCNSRIGLQDSNCGQCGAPVYSRHKNKKKQKTQRNLGEPLRVSGWSDSDFIALSQKVHAWNAEESFAVATSASFSNIFKELDNVIPEMFMGVRLTTDDEIIDVLGAFYDIPNRIFIISTDRDNCIKPLVGIIDIC